MARFLTPTARKLHGALLGLLILPGAFMLRAVPVQWDLLELGGLGGLILGLLLGVPLRIFDTLTDSAFASRAEGFLVFPSVAELAFALAADLLLFYLISCAVVRVRARDSVALE
ncbi:MAG: hypothetical protein ACI8QZ_001393 [Chlamydiales bacterium]|jgi:hypothetical protein